MDGTQRVERATPLHGANLADGVVEAPVGSMTQMGVLKYW